MRRPLLTSALCALAVTAALPSAAGADHKTRFKVSVDATVDESWRIDRAPTDACGPVQASGGATMRISVPYVDGGRQDGQYTATVDWRVKFVRIGKMPPPR